jgi:hypothetical protein
MGVESLASLSVSSVPSTSPVAIAAISLASAIWLRGFFFGIVAMNSVYRRLPVSESLGISN